MMFKTYICDSSVLKVFTAFVVKTTEKNQLALVFLISNVNLLKFNSLTQTRHVSN